MGVGASRHHVGRKHKIRRAIRGRRPGVVAAMNGWRTQPWQRAVRTIIESIRRRPLVGGPGQRNTRRRLLGPPASATRLTTGRVVVRGPMRWEARRMVGAPAGAPFNARDGARRVRRTATSWFAWYRRRLWAEVALAVVVSLVGFALAVVAFTAARDHVPAVLVGALFLLVVLAVARLAGILFALPVGVVIIQAFDWYFLPPLRALDGATVFVLGLFLAMSVMVAAITTEAGRGAAAPGRGRGGASERARAVLAEEQAGLRRVATLVAKAAPAEKVFTAVTSEVG